MKKILGIVVLGLLLSGNAYAANYKIGQKVEGQIIFNKKNKIDIPPGEWTVVDQYIWHGHGLLAQETSLAKVKNNELSEFLSVSEFRLAGVAVGYIDTALHEILLKDKYDGCYERPEYFLLKFYVKGSTHNCFWVRHVDLKKSIYNPDDPERGAYNGKFKKWIKEYSIVIPKIHLVSMHSYFSRTVGGNWFTLNYGIDPKILKAPQNTFYTEEKSEYHRYNIERFPEHKKFMHRWIELSAERHKKFEENVRAKVNHKLDLSSYYSEKSKPKNQISNKFIIQIKQLNNMYEEGVLTKEEFEKAKKKLLN